MDKRTGEIKKYKAPYLSNNVVSALCVTRDNTVWVGTDNGLCRYVAEKDTLQFVEMTLEIVDCGMLP